MPRETINTEGPFTLQVGFPKGGYVRDDTYGVQVGVVGQEQTDDGKGGINLVLTNAWAHLNRQGCNDLIRTVRKARDSAFGSDQ